MKENFNKHIESVKGKKEAAFTDIPEGYFNSLKKETIQKVTQGISQERNAFPKHNWMLVAAVILLVIAIGSVALIQNRKAQSIGSEKMAFNWQTISDTSKNLVFDPDSVVQKPLPLQQVDSILKFELSTEEIILYLLESEEFEF